MEPLCVQEARLAVVGEEGSVVGVEKRPDCRIE
jgi:hypothetical protein